MNDDEYLVKLGERIVSLRKERNLRQIDLSDKVGIEDSALRRIESGRVNSSINMLRKIAYAFNLEITELLSF